MDKKFHIFVRRHGLGATVSVVGCPELSAFGPDVGSARADLARALEGLLEQDHGDLRGMTGHWPRMELRRVDVTVRARQQRRFIQVPMRFSVLVKPVGSKAPPRGEPLTGAVEVLLPRLGMRQVIDDVSELEVWVEEYVRHEFYLAPLERLREAAYEGVESLETMTVGWRGQREPAAEEKEKRAAGGDPRDLRSRFPPLPDGLDEASRALHLEASIGLLDRAFQRDRELNMLAELVSGSRRAGVLLLGPSGAGKSALVQELAARASDEKSPLHGLEIYSTSGARIVAGMQYLGQWQARLERMIRSLRMRRAVLHIENLTEFLSSFPGNSGLDGAGYLGPAIAAGELAVILEASVEDAARAERTHASFLQALRPLPLAPLDRGGAWLALRSAAQQVGRGLSLRFEEPALRTAMDITERFFPRAPLPGSAVSLLRAAGQEGVVGGSVGPEAILDAFARRTGFPRSLVDPQARMDPEDVLAALRRRVVGQDDALALLRDLVLTLKTALADPRKPLGSFLLLGPTGVGKTESALALTEFLFGDEKRMVRIDMSEYAAPGSAARLLGLYGAEGVLTRRVREQPFGVVLLDEIEKADGSVHDLLLQLLDEGRLTDVTGRAVDFTNTVVVMTSNLGAETAGKQLGFGEQAVASLDVHYRSAAARFFRPELLNRIDHLVPYRPLDRPSVRLIVQRMLDLALGREGIARRGVAIRYEPPLLDLLADIGMDPRYGARPLKRAIEQRVVAPLAWRLASAGERPPSAIHLDVARGEVTLRETPALPPAPAPAPQPPSTSSASGHSLAPRGDPGHWV
jgi:ATP-dependent Clp protease ATP-binding subunit ClpC